jgi:hypothetical protein
MTRLATRADLRSGAWRLLWWQQVAGHAAPAEAIADTLRILWALDAEEAGDAKGARYVAAYLGRGIVETSPDGRRCRLGWRVLDRAS